MVCVEEVERESGSRAIVGRRVPSLTEKLFEPFQVVALAAATVVQLQNMKPIHIHDHEWIVEDLGSWAWSMGVIHVNHHSQLRQRGSLEESVFPFL